MKTLLNHTELALNIKNNNLENANDLYINKINMLLSLSNSDKELKKLLYSINIFVYTYLCISTSLTLEDLCNENIAFIETCHSREGLIILGEGIIKSYIKAINTSKQAPENEIINRALTYIHSNIEKKITLEKVAAHIHISSNYLCYLFKESTGFKFCEYINICRINAAKKFLINSSNALDIISSQCGFNSQSHFSTTFKKYAGVSPKEYKKNLGK
ncbi:AraC family transcriptional regulator [Clostridium sp. CS001]|uniref:helix-turn-helix transcriptional regulator n=1 Tax=Clostridium sp. CS001 TaxID=2880648 RepID=UPI001CF195E6|nr:AraC family transcriptional regulator [Clostridium sp. CS001]MCB2290599.1 AraC family transcriptional regulator [Clostridium sp. CS001]